MFSFHVNFSVTKMTFCADGLIRNYSLTPIFLPLVTVIILCIAGLTVLMV